MNNLFPALPDGAIASQIKNSQLALAANDNITNYINFGSITASWNLEPGKEDITNTRMIVDAGSFIHGWILWRAKKVDSKVSVPHYEPVPEQLPGYTQKDGTYVPSSELRGFSGFLGEANLPVSFSTCSMGGRRFCDDLLTAIKARVEAGETEFIYPAIILTVSAPYTCDNGTFANPTFDLKNWVNHAGVIAGEIVELQERRKKKQ